MVRLWLSLLLLAGAAIADEHDHVYEVDEEVVLWMNTVSFRPSLLILSLRKSPFTFLMTFGTISNSPVVFILPRCSCMVTKKDWKRLHSD